MQTNIQQPSMKTTNQIQRVAPPIRRVASIFTTCLATAILAWVGVSAPAPAAVLAPEDGGPAGPKLWPANPARHKVVILREATDKQQSAMVAAAEAAQPSKEALRQAAGDAPVPAGDKVWWYKEELGIRIPCAVSADAVAYYSDLVGKYGKQDLKRYAEPSSQLDYHASVKVHKEFKLDDKTFKDVHVVTLKLTFSQHFAATTTEGMRFQKQRVVVLDAAGKVLHLSGDGPTEVPIMAM